MASDSRAPMASIASIAVTADGTRIAYRTQGAGPALVLTNGLTTSTAFWDYLRPAWSGSHRVLTWDLPGHGESGPAMSERDARIDGQPDVLACVMDAAGIADAVQIGWSTGCQVVLEMTRRHASRCRGLVLLLGGAGRVLDTAALPLPGGLIEQVVRRMPRPAFALAIRAMASIANAPLGLGHVLPRALDLIGPSTRRQDARRITEHLMTIHPATVQTMITSAQAHSAFDLLPGISLPVLIVAGDRDPFAPSDAVGVPLHGAIVGSELVRLPQGTHTALYDHAPEIAAAVDDFIARRAPSTAR